jgi:hypothetical protein
MLHFAERPPYTMHKLAAILTLIPFNLINLSNVTRRYVSVNMRRKSYFIATWNLRTHFLNSLNLSIYYNFDNLLYVFPSPRDYMVNIGSLSAFGIFSLDINMHHCHCNTKLWQLETNLRFKFVVIDISALSKEAARP